MANSPHYGDLTTSYDANTKTLTGDWLIPKFLSHDNCIFKSQSFIIDNLPFQKWYIEAYPLGNGKENYGYVSIYLSPFDFKMSTKADWTLSLLNVDNEQFNSSDHSFTFETLIRSGSN